MTFIEESYYVSLGMRTYGGSFASALGEVLVHADMTNAERIKQTWPEHWKKYLAMGQKAESVQEKPT